MLKIVNLLLAKLLVVYFKSISGLWYEKLLFKYFEKLYSS